MKNIKLLLILLTLMALTPTAWAQGLSGSGTSTDPYLISSSADWNTFAQSVTGGTTYAGQFVKLTADITTSVMAGSHTSESNYHAFSGTFDGDGHTITLALSGSGEGTALFSDLEGATLKNLRAQGSVTTDDRRPATFAIIVFGNSTIKNCWSTVDVSSTRASGWVDGGGFVGRVSSGATLNMTGCAFHGSVTFTNGATTGGGMVGYTQNNATVNLTDCLYSPSALTLNVNAYNPRIFVSGEVAGHLTNCYYNDVAANSVLEEQGKQAYSITGIKSANVAFIGNATTYNVSGIDAYSVGMKYAGTYYAGETETVSLWLTHYNHPGYTYGNGYIASAGTLNGTGTFYTFTMPDQNVTIEPVIMAYTVSVVCTPNIAGAAQVSLDNTTWSSSVNAAVGQEVYCKTNSVIGYRRAGFAIETENGEWVDLTDNHFTMPAANVIYSVDFSIDPTYSIEHTVTLSPGMGGGEPIVYTFDPATAAPNAATAENLQFYYVNYNTLGFRLPYDYCPSSFTAPNGVYFIGWDGWSNNGYITLNSTETTFTAQWGNPIPHLSPGSYIDGNGEYHTCSNYTVLTGETTLEGGWYVVDNNITTYSNHSYPALTLNGDVTLILCNGKTMTVTAKLGINGNGHSLTIYGQSLDPNMAGTLNVNSTDDHAIYGLNYTQHSGNLQASGKNCGIYTRDGCDLTINGGSINANGGSRGIDAGNLTINGGKVEASSIWADGNITLGWTNTDDYILAGSYETDEGTIAVKSGQAFYCEEDENVIVSGTLDGDQIDAIRGKTLRPYFINYMDGNGETHICTDFTVLTGGETELEAGWYAVDHDITYDSTLTLNGDVTLILCDSTTMTVTADNGGGIVGDNIMTIYGQSLDSIAAGTLNVTNNDWQFAAIHPSNYIQHSGNVVASNSDGEALYANYITMNGGNITASGSSFGIKADFDMNLNGGTIIVNNNNTAQAPTNLVVTPAANNVLSATVSWTNPSKTLNNSNLTNIDQIVVCRNNEIIYTEDNVTPGANMTITDDRVPRFDAFQYSVYAVCNGAHGKIIYLDNIAFGPTCGWTINVTQASFQGFRGGKIHVYNAAGTDIAQITTTNSTAQTIPVDMPVGRVSFGWSAPTQSGSFTMAFTIMDSQNNTVYTYSGSSDQLTEGIFCETNNGCGNSAGDGVPTNVVALVDEENPNNINVSWDPIRPDGYGYTVYRDGMLYRLIPNDTSFVDENASLGGHCYVVGFLGDGGENGLYSNESCATSGECYAPRNLDYEYTGSTNKIKLLWERPEPHDGLSGYYLYRKFGEDDEYVRIKVLSANATSYIDNLANHEGNYYYKLYAYYGDLNCTSAPAYWIHDHNQFYLLAPYSSNGVYEMECQGESVDINDGTIIANYNRNQGNSYSGLSINGNLVINGGKVEAYSIWAQNDITLGWTSPNDYILAGSYEAVEGTVTVKTGQAFYYGNNVIVSGTLDEDQINAIGGKTLRPYIVPTTVTKDIAGYGTGDGGWQLIALPLQGAFHPTSINNMVADTAAHYDLYRFEPSHEDNEWENYKASNTFKLETGKGYLYANTDNVTLTFSGPSYIGDSCEIALVYDSTDYQKCWNLVGNPFDCNATLNREYYVLDESGLGINPEPIPATTPIPPCTAVFVKAVAEGDKAVFTRVTQ